MALGERNCTHHKTAIQSGLHKWSHTNAADHECKYQMTLKMSRATISLYGNTQTHGRVRTCVCTHTNIHIHWPSGLLQQPAKCVIRLANQAEAEGCLPFISRCVCLVCVCPYLFLLCCCPLSPLTLSFYCSLSVSHCLHQDLEQAADVDWLQTKYLEMKYTVCKILLNSHFGTKITIISCFLPFCSN